MEPNARIEKLKAQRQQITNRIARLRNVERAKERKRQTRRKILAGAWVLGRAEADPDAWHRLRKGMDGYLTRPKDRELFDLPPQDTEAPPPRTSEDE